MNQNLLNEWGTQFQLWVRRHALPLFFVCLLIGMTLILARGIGEAFVQRNVERGRLSDFLLRQA